MSVRLSVKALAGKPTLVAFALLFALAACLRFDFLFSVAHHVTQDSVNYDLMVRQLLEHGVYGYGSEQPNAKIPPGYPLFMAEVYRLVGYERHDPYPAIRCLQAVMSLATMLLAVRIAERLGGRVASLTTAAVMAVYPPFIWANGAILTEPLAALLLMLYLDLQLRALDKPGFRSSFFAGAALGLAMLTRSEFAVLLGGAYLFFWYSRRNARLAAKHFLFALIGAVFVLSPWVMRNVVTLHEPIVASTQVNPFAAGTYPDKNYDDGLVDRHGKTQMEVALERIRVGFTQHTWTFAKWYTVGKLRAIYGRMFFGSGHSPLYPVIPFGQPFHVAVVLGGVLSGARLLLRQRRSPALLVAVAVGVLSVTRLAFVPEYRYNFTAMPMLIVLDGLLAASLAAAVGKRLGGRRRSSAAAKEESAHAAI